MLAEKWVPVTPETQCALQHSIFMQVGNAVSHFEGAIKEVDVTLSVSGGDAGHGKRRQRTEITLYTLRNGIVRAEDEEENM